MIHEFWKLCDYTALDDAFILMRDRGQGLNSN